MKDCDTLSNGSKTFIEILWSCGTQYQILMTVTRYNVMGLSCNIMVLFYEIVLKMLQGATVAEW